MQQIHVVNYSPECWTTFSLDGELLGRVLIQSLRTSVKI